MIVVKVELHSANTGEITELARMIIANEGGTDKKCDYSVGVLRGRSKEALDKSSANRILARIGKVHNHSRLSKHVWNLVSKALISVGYSSKN